MTALLKINSSKKYLIENRTLNSLVCSVLASVIFVFSHPNPVFTNGLPTLAYFLIFPLSSMLFREKLVGSVLFSALFGLSSYFFSTVWIGTFHTVALFFVALFYFFFYAFFGAVIYFLKKIFHSKVIFLIPVIWVLFEYAKTLGFFGFPYGIIAYTQWQFLPVVQWASLLSVFFVSFVVVSFGATLFWLYEKTRKHVTSIKATVNFSSIKKAAIPFFVWCSFFIFLFFVGTFFLTPKSALFEKDADIADLSDFYAVALVQPNSDPWKEGVASYEANFRTLKLLSQRGISELKEVAYKNSAVAKSNSISPEEFLKKNTVVVWSETAFVPRILLHYKNRWDKRIFTLVNDLLEFINSSEVPFVVGNDHAVEDSRGNVLDYNSALFFVPKENVIPPAPYVYSKIKLVPFTEYFPYEKTFPRLYDFLSENGSHFWEPGKENVLFDFSKQKLGNLICFEDVFSSLAKKSVQDGATAIISMTNDSWSGSEACQNQHLSMAVFRAVENRVPIFRASASGVTCGIDVNGKIVGELEPFKKDCSIVLCKKSNIFPSTTYSEEVFVLVLIIFVIILFIVDKTREFSRK